MTRYTVIWLEAALEELATLWMNTVDRDGVTTAAHVVDQELAEDPDRKGVEKDPGIRRLTVSPLLVLYTVREPDRIVEVTSVKLSAAEASGNGAPLP
jgi:hypothetical protein